MATRCIQVKRLEELRSKYSRFFWRGHRQIDVFFGAGGRIFLTGGTYFLAGGTYFLGWRQGLEARVQASAGDVVLGLAQRVNGRAPPFSTTQATSCTRVPNPSLAYRCLIWVPTVR
jgi:hypothetical protein